MADKPTSNKIPPWSSLTPSEIKVLKELGITKDSYLKDMKKFMESSESNQRLDRRENESMGVVPLPEPRPTRPYYEAKTGGLVSKDDKDDKDDKKKSKATKPGTSSKAVDSAEAKLGKITPKGLKKGGMFKVTRKGPMKKSKK